MKSLILLSIFCPFAASSVAFDDVNGTVSLKISQGELLGKRIDSYDNRTGYGFLGIPFGAPTDGPRRFAKPLPASGWDGVRDVTQKGDACAATAKLTYKRPEGGPMSEDCLHNYVYASRNCLTKGGCPIMWVVHGGRYNFESPVVFVDDAIVHNFASDNQDVVVVIPAYRLINFGFLNLAPGLNVSAVPNTGVWDLLLAMEWTHREIHYFGGDPNQITIFGHSAGSSFSDILSTSPYFHGKFNRMIMMSGADTMYEAGVESNSKASWVTATKLGCADSTTDRRDVPSIEAVIECMRGKSWQEIVAANEAMNDRGEDYHGPHADGEGGILPSSPSILAATSPAFSIMIGTTSAEFHDTKYAIRSDTLTGGNLTRVGELCEALCYSAGFKRPEEMVRRCMERYMEGKNAQSFEEDVIFYAPAHHTAMNLAKKGGKVYLYSFSYTGIGEAFKKYSKLAEGDHPGHSEDYVYILGMHRGNFTQKDYEIERIYSGMVLHFVKTGYPNPGAGQPEWKPFNRLQKNYYNIDFDANLTMPGMKSGYHAEVVKLWINDAEKYGGGYSDPHEYPRHLDRFFPMDLTTAYSSHHLHESTAHDKTLAATEDNYRAWIEYVNNRRFKHLQGLKNFRSAIIEQPHVALAPVADNHLIEILIICVSAILIFLLLRCCLHCANVYQERKGYQEF